MIIVKLTGGLGNQMFQYAAGRSLAHAHNTDFKLDLTWFNNMSEATAHRNYALDIFSIQAQRASIKDINMLTNIANNRFLLLLVKYARGFTPLGRSYFHEKYFHFDPLFFILPNNVYLEGYWQSEKYFLDIKDIIIREFTFSYQQDPLGIILANEIKSVDSISIHVRRGDYVSSPANNLFHGTCSVSYYKKAMELLAKRITNPFFFIFSDDPDWAKKNLTSPFQAKYIEHNGPEKAYEDMRLMSLCKHHIIANSSFSWWGAWLCNNPGKIVIAPKDWFRDKTINTNDLIPDGWIRL